MQYRLLLVFLLLGEFVFSQTPYFKSASYYRGDNSNYIENIAVDGQGNVYSAGYFFGQITLGSHVLNSASNSDGYVMKTDTSGNVLWVNHLSGVSRVDANAIGKDPLGNIYVGGLFRESMTAGNVTLTAGTDVNSIFLLKYNAAGTLIWARQMDGPASPSEYYSCSMNDLCTDQDGNIYFTGFFTNSISYQSVSLSAYGRNDILVGKLDPQGDVLWMHKAGGTRTTSCGLPNNDNGAGICLDSKGNVIITGHYANNATFDNINLTAQHNVDVYTAKYDNQGNVLWAVSEGGTSWEMASSVACDPNDNIYTLGHFQLDITIGTQQFTSVSQTGSQYDVFLIKYDSAGAVQWAKQEGGNLSEYGEEVVTDDVGNVYISGRHFTNSVIAGVSLNCWSNSDTRCFIAKYDNAGSPQYVVNGGGYDNFPRAMALNPQNDIVLAGNTSGISQVPAEFGAFPAPTQNGRYAFITVLDDPFNLVGIPEWRETEIGVYPNPSNGMVNLSFPLEVQDRSEIVVTDMSGRKVWQGSHSEGALDLRFLNPGVYILLVRGKKSQVIGHQLLQLN